MNKSFWVRDLLAVRVFGDEKSESESVLMYGVCVRVHRSRCARYKTENLPGMICLVEYLASVILGARNLTVVSSGA